MERPLAERIRKPLALEAQLFCALRKKALEGDLAAIKFLLTNLWPERWQDKPQPGKPTALDLPTDLPQSLEVPPPVSANDEPPFRFRLNRGA